MAHLQKLCECSSGKTTVRPCNRDLFEQCLADDIMCRKQNIGGKAGDGGLYSIMPGIASGQVLYCA